MIPNFKTFFSRFFAPEVNAAAPLAGIAAAGPAVVLESVVSKENMESVQALIGQVSDLTSTVAQDVGKHNINVQAISSELAATGTHDANAISALVCKLILANQQLQSRLERAEGTLQAHSRQLHDAISSARTDGLTGLMNRRALDEELRRCLTELQGQGRPAVLLMIDVDHFKQFNDTFGHVAGDQALIHVSETLRTQSRATDLVARYGGEEFAVIFTAATAAAVRDRAERLRLSIGRRTVTVDGREMQVTASAGMADASTDDTTLDWIHRADSALYAAKRAGRNCTFLTTEEGMEPLTIAGAVEEPGEALVASSPSPTAPRSISNSAAELATEAFADTSFVQTIAKRIAEWRRGGTTLTVVLARLDQPLEEDDFGEDSDETQAQQPMRLAMKLARKSTRDMDLVTRWNSDGIAMLLPSTSAADAKVVARRLRNALAAEEVQGLASAAPISLSMGIAEGIEGNDAKRVLERAWLALDAARVAGPANVFVHDGLKTVAVKVAATAR